jgi:hypothetical protein
MDNHFGGVIWTNHALDRLRERGIKQGDAWATWRNPQASKKGSIAGSWIYYRDYGDTQIEVVAKQSEKRQWIIISVWSRPVIKNGNPPKSLWKTLVNKLFG